MKTTTIVALVLGLILTTMSCDFERGAYVEYNHGFITDVFTPENTLLLQQTPFKLQMTPNLGEVADLEYIMEYRVTKGDGYFKTLNDSVIDKAKPYEMQTDSLNRVQQFHFVPTTEDQVTIAMKISDVYGGLDEFEVNYMVENPPFTISVTPETTTPFEETTTPITVELVQQEESEMQYQAKLNTPSDLSDLGTITTQDGTTLVTDKWYPIAVGKSTWQFEALEAGDYPLSITIKDEFKQEVTQRVTLNIKNVTFDATLTADPATLFETKQGSITLDITQENPATITYTATLNTVSPLATLTLPNGKPMQPDVPYDMVLGKNTLQLQAVQPGTYTVDITVIDSNGKEVPKTLDIIIKGVSFALEATADKSTFFETDSTPITLNLSQDPTNIPLSYEVRLNTVSNIGTLTFENGTTMNPTEWYDMSLGEMPLTFTSITHGTYNTDFTVRVKGQPERTDTVNKTITVRKTDFTLQGRIDKPEIEVRTDANFYSQTSFATITLNSELIGLRDDLNYEASFTTSGIGTISISQYDQVGNRTYEPNEKIRVNNHRYALFGTQGYSLYYSAQSGGAHTITLKITASNGVEKTVTVRINVRELPIVRNGRIRTVRDGIRQRYYVSFDYNIPNSVSSNKDPETFTMRIENRGQIRIEQPIVFNTATKNPLDTSFLEFKVLNLLNSGDTDTYNFYQGARVSIQIASDTGVSSNWTYIGTLP